MRIIWNFNRNEVLVSEFKDNDIDKNNLFLSVLKYAGNCNNINTCEDIGFIDLVFISNEEYTDNGNCISYDIDREIKFSEFKRI